MRSVAYSGDLSAVFIEDSDVRGLHHNSQTTVMLVEKQSFYVYEYIYLSQIVFLVDTKLYLRYCLLINSF